MFQEIINNHCSNCLYDFDWKKPVQQRLSVDKEDKSRNVSILVNNVNGHSTLNESHLQNEEIGNNNYKEGKLKNNIFAKNNKDKNDNELDNDSPDFNASPIIKERKLQKQEILNEDSIDQLKAINKKRNNSLNQVEKYYKRKVTSRKSSSPIKPSNLRKTSQPLFSETEKNFGLLVKELNEKKNSDELKNKEEALKGSNLHTISDNQIENDNTKLMLRNSITPLENKNEKHNINPSAKCKFNIKDLNGKDMTKCNCMII